jgi:hypothetical protein
MRRPRTRYQALALTARAVAGAWLDLARRVAEAAGLLAGSSARALRDAWGYRP